MVKQPNSFRLSEECMAQMGEMAARLGLTKADIIELAVRYYHDEKMPRVEEPIEDPKAVTRTRLASRSS